jgi:hypothetical protein
MSDLSDDDSAKALFDVDHDEPKQEQENDEEHSR